MEWITTHASPRWNSSKVAIEGLPKEKREAAIDALVWKYPTWFFEILVEFEGKPLVLEPFQIRYLLDNSQFKITNKTRQAGGSVQLALAKFWKAYTNENYRCDIVSISMPEAADKITKIKAFWETIPKRYQLPLQIDNALSIGFHRGKSRMSVIHSRAASGSIRGARKDIVFDEFAHIREAEELFRAALPAIMNGNLGVDIVSTPRGRRNMFGDMWANEVDPEKGIRPYDMFSRHQFIWLDVRRFVTDYEAVQHKWYVEYKQDWSKMEELIQQYGSDTMKFNYVMNPWEWVLQEYCGQFLDDTYSLFPYSILDKVFKSDISKLRHRLNEEEQEFLEADYLDSWNERTERPEGHDGQLVMGVDFGKSGKGNDKTSIQILEKNGDMLLHRYSRNLERVRFPDFPSQAEEIAKVAAGFRVNKIICDETGLGLGIVPLIRRMLPNRKVEGVEFTNTLKEEMMMNLKSLMEREKIWLMKDERGLYNELHNMQAVQTPAGNIRYHGEPHDDMVWALALAANEGTYKHFAIYTIDALLKGYV